MTKGKVLLLAVAVGFLIGLLTGCTRFEVGYPDGSKVVQWGAPLVSRNDNFVITHQWLDESSNTLHEVRIERYTEESADSQLKMMQAAFDMGLKAGTP
jgi:hypothetical protein